MRLYMLFYALACLQIPGSSSSVIHNLMRGSALRCACDLAGGLPLEVGKLAYTTSERKYYCFTTQSIRVDLCKAITRAEMMSIIG
jgi:hypothetical protein